MQTESAHIIKNSEVKVDGSYTLEIGPLAQAGASSQRQAPASTTPKAVLVENQDDFAVITPPEERLVSTDATADAALASYLTAQYTAGAVGGEDRSYRNHARQGMHDLLGQYAQRLQLGALARVDLDHETDVAVLDHQPRDHFARDDVGAAAGLDYGFERLHDLVFGNLTHP